jgi:multidrug efflux pump subunit AcrA (membrane-fusion protein)
MLRTVLTLTGLFLSLITAAVGAPTGRMTGTARLSSPEAAALVLNAVVSLPVAALPVRPGDPVKKGTILAEMDVAKLERVMRELQRSLRDVQ